MFDLKKYDTETLAKIHNILNYWEWPNELGEKPGNWDTMPEHLRDKGVVTKYETSSPIMAEIKNIIGLKECLRWHHLNNLGRTNEQFENWWKNEHDTEFDTIS